MSTLSAIMFAKRRSEVKTERRNKAIVKYTTNVQKRLKENECSKDNGRIRQPAISICTVKTPGTV